MKNHAWIFEQQEQKQANSSEIETLLSNNATSITFDNGSYYSSNGLNVSIERI